jgi:6-phosphogluconolactonase
MRRRPELVVLPDVDAAARRGAAIVAAAARAASAERGAFAFAVSGGSGALPMWDRLADEELPWDRTRIWQVDERIAPEGDADRNLTGLLEHLPEPARALVRPMPVTDADVEAAARSYAAELPDALDLIHLGIGADGHTASLVPSDPVLEVTDRDVAITGEYQGRRRMTLTYPVLGRARFVLWFVHGEDKAAILPTVLDGDPSVPAGRVRAERQLFVIDEAAASRIGRGGTAATA